MVNLMSQVIDSYHDLMDNNSDPRVKDWFMMSSPIPTMLICLLYVYVVKVAGPKMMKNRKAFELREVLMVYNLVQVLLSGWICYEGLVSGWWNDYSFRCQPVDQSTSPKAMRMAATCWWYHIAKYTELLDTIFFIMRKKDNQASKLHVIHHGVMPFITWFGVKFSPGGHLTFFGLLNTFVHVIMYGYYFLAALGPKIQPYLWWKKYLTALQMIQFTCILIHSMQLFFIDCEVSMIFAWWTLIAAVSFFYLFAKFYVESYNQEDKIEIQEHKKSE